MFSTGVRNCGHWHLLLLVIGFLCLYETVFAQTFHFSRGWTNGKKRSSFETFTPREIDRPEMMALCQMDKLQEIWESRHLNREYLPCDVIETTEAEMGDRRGRRRRGCGCDRVTLSNSFTRKPN